MAINGEPLRTAQVDDGRHIMPGMLGVAAPRRGEIWIVPADPIEEQCPLCVLEWRHGGWRHGRSCPVRACERPAPKQGRPVARSS